MYLVPVHQELCRLEKGIRKKLPCIAFGSAVLCFMRNFFKMSHWFAQKISWVEIRSLYPLQRRYCLPSSFMSYIPSSRPFPLFSFGSNFLWTNWKKYKNVFWHLPESGKNAARNSRLVHSLSKTYLSSRTTTVKTCNRRRLSEVSLVLVIQRLAFFFQQTVMCSK